MSASWTKGRAVLRLIAFLVGCLLMAGLYVLALPFGRQVRHKVQRLWSQLTCRIANLRVRYRGDIARGAPVLFVANHVSYFDIPALGARLEAVFVAKSEVAGWPLFGAISRLTNTVFIPRDPRQARIQAEHLKERVTGGESLILFAEGTNGDGREVLPFKSSLLQLADPAHQPRPLFVQPVSIVFRSLTTGEPLTAERGGLYAWVQYDDMAPHLWRAMQQSGAVVEVIIHEPVEAADRKTLAMRCHATVAGGVEQIWKETIGTGLPPEIPDLPQMPAPMSATGSG